MRSFLKRLEMLQTLALLSGLAMLALVLAYLVLSEK